MSVLHGGLVIFWRGLKNFSETINFSCCNMEKFSTYLQSLENRSVSLLKILKINIQQLRDGCYVKVNLFDIIIVVLPPVHNQDQAHQVDHQVVLPVDRHIHPVQEVQVVAVLQVTGEVAGVSYNFNLFNSTYLKLKIAIIKFSLIVSLKRIS